MKFKIDKDLVPVKAHFFFFFAALGPILPQLNVYGRQLGVSPSTMGFVTAVLPLLWALAKPLFGFIVDFWPARRKLVFMLLISIMSGTYCCLWFLPSPTRNRQASVTSLVESVYQLNDTIYLKKIDDPTIEVEKYTCHWSCSNDHQFDVYLTNSTYVNTVYVDVNVTNDSCSLFQMELDDVREGEIVCVPKVGCNLLCFEDDSLTRDVKANLTGFTLNETINDLIVNGSNKDNLALRGTDVSPTVDIGELYKTEAFWGFVVLMCVGTVAFNVANCIGDAVCFDVLGAQRASKYGTQRAWGTAGYGLTAVTAGWLIDTVSTSRAYKDYTPAFIIVLVATVIDLFSCRALTLPSMSSPNDSGKALREVLKIPRVLLFIVFAVVAGTFDSFIVYYVFWFLEELADTTGHTATIKLIEGVVVAAQCVGEIVFFFFSGSILKRFGFGVILSFSLICYGLRMGLISLITNPWHLVLIEGIMQGPTYALCYASIVGYAAQVAPEGYSATVQGIVAGMDDGLGFAVGSLAGGQLYSWTGGRAAFQLFAGVGLTGAVLHALLYALVTKKQGQKAEQPPTQEEDEKMLPEVHSTAIYRNTTEPLKGDR